MGRLTDTQKNFHKEMYGNVPKEPKDRFLIKLLLTVFLMSVTIMGIMKMQESKNSTEYSINDYEDGKVASNKYVRSMSFFMTENRSITDSSSKEVMKVIVKIEQESVPKECEALKELWLKYIGAQYDQTLMNETSTYTQDKADQITDVKDTTRQAIHDEMTRICEDKNIRLTRSVGEDNTWYYTFTFSQGSGLF